MEAKEAMEAALEGTKVGGELRGDTPTGRAPGKGGTPAAVGPLRCGLLLWGGELVRRSLGVGE